jgi:hypothetical protein
MRSMRKLVLANDVARWSAEFLTALRAAGENNATDDDDDALGELEVTIERIRRR